MNDDKLILYYYRDGLTPDERQRIASALATDPALAERYRALTADLALLPDDEPAPVPADMMERWHASIDRAATLQLARSRPRRLHSWSVLFGVAVTAALAVGVSIGLRIAGGDYTGVAVEPLAAVVQPVVTGGSSAFLRGLRVHLRDSEKELSVLPASSDDRRRLLMNIIDQNRLFERAAEQNDAAHLARVLRAFELVLIELAAEDTGDDEAEEIRTKLIFELNAMLTKLSRETSNEPKTI